MELKIKLGGVEYTAPPPKVSHFKQYIKLLRMGQDKDALKEAEDIDAELAFIASLFTDDHVTVQRIREEATFADAAQLHRDFLPWLGQYLPDVGKNVKAR